MVSVRNVKLLCVVLNLMNIYALNETQFTKKVRESSLFFDKTAPKKISDAIAP